MTNSLTPSDLTFLAEQLPERIGKFGNNEECFYYLRPGCDDIDALLNSAIKPEMYLGLIWEIEEKVMDKQWGDYIKELRIMWWSWSYKKYRHCFEHFCIHATESQRIEALRRVLKGTK